MYIINIEFFIVKLLTYEKTGFFSIFLYNKGEGFGVCYHLFILKDWTYLSENIHGGFFNTKYGYKLGDHWASKSQEATMAVAKVGHFIWSSYALTTDID